jgi:hypothetical protein
MAPTVAAMRKIRSIWSTSCWPTKSYAKCPLGGESDTRNSHVRSGPLDILQPWNGATWWFKLDDFDVVQVVHSSDIT